MEENNREYKNNDITVFWKPDHCIHSSICWKSLIEVFNPNKRPWVNMNGSSTGKIIETVKKCPSMALSYKWNDDRKDHPENTEKPGDVSLTAEIWMKADGPFEIKGKVRIFDAEGRQLPGRPLILLCRCGASKQMPFCDSSHRRIKFKG
jgi:uncharacterized Fe-S cluster protein YjdI